MSAVIGRSSARGYYSGVKGAGGGGGGGGDGGGGAGGGTFNGKWQAYGWEYITISQNGNSVTAKYSEYWNHSYPKGTFSGNVQGDKLFFTWTNVDGNVGEGYIFPNYNGKKWGINYCMGRGCDPVNGTKPTEAVKQ